MAPSSRSLSECHSQTEARQTFSLAGLAITILVVVIGLYLVDALRAEAAFQDCLLAGQPACSSPFPVPN